MNNETKDLLSDLELVHRQLHCVKHLCDAVSGLADAQIRLLPKLAINPDFGHHMIKMQGSWSNAFMQWVGEMLNGMDAVDPDQDKRWDETFQQASKRWENLTEELNARTVPAEFFQKGD